MGLTIHYTARLRDRSRLHELTAEVADICQSLDWDCSLHPDNPAGIVFSPHPESESVWLTFGADGWLIHPIFQQMRAEQPDKARMLRGAFTKTQFAGPATHVAVVGLLRHLFDKYCTDVVVRDEGHYWDTHDLAVLQEHFAAYSEMFNAVFAALEHLPPGAPGESVDDLVARIRAAVQGIHPRDQQG